MKARGVNGVGVLQERVDTLRKRWSSLYVEFTAPEQRYRVERIRGWLAACEALLQQGHEHEADVGVWPKVLRDASAALLDRTDSELRGCAALLKRGAV